MSKLSDFYQKASADGDLKNELMAVNKKFREEKTLTKETAVPEVILIAAKHGITLEPADFEQLTDDQLASVAGAGYYICGILDILPEAEGGASGQLPTC
ncbi:hypothetical protein AGMMS49928_23480 [Spirochaetia bacterium]|nr:hypothetical protein AGMMS49928_23480 [Spirochaetia bacterium]